MSREYFRACDNPYCRICHRWMADEPPAESPWWLALATLGLVLLAIFFLFALPGLAS